MSLDLRMTLALLNTSHYYTIDYDIIILVPGVFIIFMLVRKIAKKRLQALSCLSVPSSAWNKIASHWMDVHKIWCLRIFRKSVAKIQVPLKSDNNNRYFTWSPIYSYDYISLNSTQNEKCVRQKLQGKSKHILCRYVSPFHRPRRPLWRVEV